MEGARADHKLVPGLVLGGIALGCLLLGRPPLLALLLVMGLLASGEAFRLARSRGIRPVGIVGIAGVAAAFVVAYQQGDRSPENLPLVVGLSLLAASAAVILRRNRAGAVSGVATTIFVVVYIGLLGSYMLAIRGAHDGFRIALTFGLMVLLNDAGAYALGRIAGRHPLAPTVSPRKTWEGAAGGTLTTFAVGIITGLTLSPPMTLGRGLVLAALVSVTAPLGDLFESMLTRDFGVKDSGAVIPAHGGALDVIDSLVFSAPVFFYAYRVLAG